MLESRPVMFQRIRTKSSR